MDEEQIAREIAEAMEPGVRAFIAVTEDVPDAARGWVRSMSVTDRAVLSFHLSELSRIVSEEDEFRTTADRRQARAAFLVDGD
jgi:hypothetical protein